MAVLVLFGEELGDEINSHSWSSEEHDDEGGLDDDASIWFGRSMLTAGGCGYNGGFILRVWLLLTGLPDWQIVAVVPT